MLRDLFSLHREIRCNIQKSDLLWVKRRRRIALFVCLQRVTKRVVVVVLTLKSQHKRLRVSLDTIFAGKSECRCESRCEFVSFCKKQQS